MLRCTVIYYDVFNRSYRRNCYDGYWRGIIRSRGDKKVTLSNWATTTTQPGEENSLPIDSVEQEEHGVSDEKEIHSSPIKSDITSIADELSKLLALKEKGVLTEEEFARLKKIFWTARIPMPRFTALYILFLREI